MPDHFDELETREPEKREAEQFAALRAQIADAQKRAPGWTRQLEGITADDVTDRSALAKLPVLRKSELVEMQKAAPPFGGLTARPAGRARAAPP